MPSRADRASAGPIIRGSVLGSLSARCRRGSILAASPPTRWSDLAPPERRRDRGRRWARVRQQCRRADLFIPLTLGIPSHPLMALMIGALMIQGITPARMSSTNGLNCSGA
jgi:hypothetical protein